jgi:hypothetical protein
MTPSRQITADDDLTAAQLDEYYADEPSEVGVKGENPGAQDRRMGRVAVRENEQLDVALVTSQFGDRVLFEAQLTLVEDGPQSLEQLLGHVIPAVQRDETYVRKVLRENKARFRKLADGRIALSEEALR